MNEGLNKNRKAIHELKVGIYIYIYMRAYLAWSVALQFKHVHRIIHPPTIVIKLNIPSQALNAHLHELQQCQCE